MVDDFFWTLVKRFNTLMNSAIVGPNCIDPNICKGDCCSIKIDVPKVLASEYIRRRYAHKEDFIRSNVFSFKLRFDEHKGKCFLFDKSINGCSVHKSGIKPPQCWIYPTNFSNPQNKEINCKKAGGWKIIDSNKTKQAENILQKYVFLCQLEAKHELKNINNRLGNIISKNSVKKIRSLRKRIKKFAPSQFGGFIDTWDNFKILSSEGLSLQLKKFCREYNKDCNYLSDNFFDCKNICDIVSNKLIDLLNNNLFDYIKINGPDTDGQYPLFKIFEFVQNRENEC